MHKFIRLAILGLAVVGSSIGFSSAQAQTDGALTFSLESIGHWHVFNEKTLTVTVSDNNGPVSGLDVKFTFARAGSDRVTTRSVSDGRVTDNGDGTYSVTYTVSSIGAWAIQVSASNDGMTYASDPTAFDVSLDGEEGILVTANGTQYVYQIRYYWAPGHVHASETNEVQLVFDIMRGIPEGGDINLAQPWRNAFDYIVDAQDAIATVTSGDLTENLIPEYMGKGRYIATRIFAAAEVGHERDYEVKFSFVDPYNGATVTHSEAYELHAVESH